jgi:hypothetical protein
MPRRRQGRFLGMPYDFRRPTWKRVRRTMWNPRDPRVLVGKAYGWGYDVNVAALLRKIAGRAG